MTTEIAVLNQSTTIADADVQAMIPAFQTQWNRDLAPIWGIEPCSIAFAAAGSALPPEAWWLVFLDNSDQADALAYHDLTNLGLPISKVFVKTLLADKASISVGASHELVEMAVDPWLNGGSQSISRAWWATETADPVEADEYGYKIGDVLVTNFVTPSWFGHPHSAAPFDFTKQCIQPFEVLTGGYAQTLSDQKAGWQQITGPKARHFARAHAAPGSRRERRSRHWTAWKTSNPTF